MKTRRHEKPRNQPFSIPLLSAKIVRKPQSRSKRTRRITGATRNGDPDHPPLRPTRPWIGITAKRSISRSGRSTNKPHGKRPKRQRAAECWSIGSSSSKITRNDSSIPMIQWQPTILHGYGRNSASKDSESSHFWLRTIVYRISVSQ